MAKSTVVPATERALQQLRTPSKEHWFLRAEPSPYPPPSRTRTIVGNLSLSSADFA